MLRILHDTNYDFIRWWKVMAAITVAFILLAMAKERTEYRHRTAAMVCP